MMPFIREIMTFHKYPAKIGSDINVIASIIHRGSLFPKKMGIKLIRPKFPSLRDFVSASFS
jgi:hypothetical protein